MKTKKTKQPAVRIITWKAREHRTDPVMLSAARDLANCLGLLRRDLWRKYGSLQAWGKNTRNSRKGVLDGLEAEIKVIFPPSQYGIAFKPWVKTVEAVFDDIHMVQEAAKAAVIRKIYQRYGQNSVKFRALNTLDWMQDPVLHRWMRKAFVRGHTKVNNQITLCVGGGAKIERKNRITTVTIPGAPINGKNNRYHPIVLHFKTGRVIPKTDITLLFKEDGLWLHYVVRRALEKRANNELIGVDKGYTEALYGSDGNIYGAGLGRLLTRTTEQMNKKGKARNRLYQLAKTNPGITENNLGRKTLNSFTAKKHAAISNILRAGVNKLYSRFGRVACEDLSKHIPTKFKIKKVNRKLSNWCKGEIHFALEQGAIRTSSELIVVSACYTSQVDSITKTLLGRRNGDYFYRYWPHAVGSGDVLQADENAACTIKDYVSDPEISRWMKAETVRTILIDRTAKYLAKMGETLESAAEKGWLDPKFLVGRSGKVNTLRKTRYSVVAKTSSRRPRVTLSQNTCHVSAL